MRRRTDFSDVLYAFAIVLGVTVIALHVLVFTIKFATWLWQ